MTTRTDVFDVSPSTTTTSASTETFILTSLTSIQRRRLEPSRRPTSCCWLFRFTDYHPLVQETTFSTGAPWSFLIDGLFANDVSHSRLHADSSSSLDKNCSERNFCGQKFYSFILTSVWFIHSETSLLCRHATKARFHVYLSQQTFLTQSTQTLLLFLSLLLIVCCETEGRSAGKGSTQPENDLRGDGAQRFLAIVHGLLVS